MSSTHSSSRPSGIWQAWSERTPTGRKIQFLVYAKSGDLFLKADDREWPLETPNLSFLFEPSASSWTTQFTVRELGQPDWSVTYVHIARTLSAKMDPTYDALDLAMEHPLAIVAENATSKQWRQAVLQAISAASGAA